MIPPDTIKILSDNNTLSYLRTVKEKDGSKHEYIYKTSITKKGEKISFTDEQLLALIKTNSK